MGMASINSIAFLSILLLLHSTTTLSDFLSPLLAPLFDEVCKEAVCGKGKCINSQNSTFSYECECDPGWKQARADKDDNLKFLPCVIPSCTVNHACAATSAPFQDKALKADTSIFDPCHWTNCGGGFCNKTSAFTYNCVCKEGFYNLLNATAFPCYQGCEIGMDCTTIGLPMPNMSPTVDPALPDNSNNQAGLSVHRDYHWLIIPLMSLAMVY
ncbi:hypothetical protein SLA2020_501230 [Shorea laevis]